MVIPLLESLDIAGKTITADALLTQRKLAHHLIERNADYVFTVKGNQPTLHDDIRLIFAGRATPDFTESLTLAHGRIEQRSIWTSTRLNDYLDFPGVGQVFVIERLTIEKTTGATSSETVYGVTSHPRQPPAPPPYWPSTAAIGPSKMAATTSSTGIGTRIAAPSAPDTVPRTSPRYAASPSVPSRLSPATRSPRPSSAWRVTFAWSSTTCA